MPGKNQVVGGVTNTSTVRGPGGANQQVGSSPTKQTAKGAGTNQVVGGAKGAPTSDLVPPVKVAPPTSDLAPPVKVAPPNSFLMALKSLKGVSKPGSSARQAPRTESRPPPRAPKNTLTSRARPGNTLFTRSTTRAPRDTATSRANNAFGVALKKRRFSSDDPTALRSRIAAIRSSF